MPADLLHPATTDDFAFLFRLKSEPKKGHERRIVVETMQYVRRKYHPERIIAWITQQTAASVKIHERALYRRSDVVNNVRFGGGDATMVLFVGDP